MKQAPTQAARASVEAVWRERAGRLSRRPPAAPRGNALLVMVVVLGGERYGIDLPATVEALPPAALTPVPGAPPALAGVLNVHGEIRPVLDLRSLLGMSAEPHSGLVNVILLRHRGRVLGLPVDSVEHIRSIAVEELEGCGGLPVRYLKGITRDRLQLLCTEALFSELFKGVNT